MKINFTIKYKNQEIKTLFDIPIVVSNYIYGPPQNAGSEFKKFIDKLIDDGITFNSKYWNSLAVNNEIKPLDEQDLDYIISRQLDNFKSAIISHSSELLDVEYNQLKWDFHLGNLEFLITSHT